jgi:hypothetical protein
MGMVQEQLQKVRAAKVKANNPSLSKKERKRHKINVRQQHPIHGFFSKKIKTMPTPTSASASSTSPPSSPNATVRPTPSSTSHPSAPNANPSPPTPSSTSSPATAKFCQGIFHDYLPIKAKKKGPTSTNSDALVIYGQNCAVNEQLKYKIGKVGPYYQMFAKNCTGCTSVHNRNIKKAHWNCNNCHAFKVSGNIYKIGQTICKHSNNILRAIAITKRSEMTDADFSDLQSFVNCNSNAT